MIKRHLMQPPIPGTPVIRKPLRSEVALATPAVSTVTLLFDPHSDLFGTFCAECGLEKTKTPNRPGMKPLSI